MFAGDGVSGSHPARLLAGLRRADLLLNIRPVRLRIWSGAKLDHGSVIYLVAHAVRRSLSTLTLEDPRQTDPLLEDLQRFVTGNPPARREPHEPTPRTAYDDRLDRDLATVD